MLWYTLQISRSATWDPCLAAPPDGYLPTMCRNRKGTGKLGGIPGGTEVGYAYATLGHDTLINDGSSREELRAVKSSVDSRFGFWVIGEADWVDGHSGPLSSGTAAACENLGRKQPPSKPSFIERAEGERPLKCPKHPMPMVTGFWKRMCWGGYRR